MEECSLRFLFGGEKKADVRMGGSEELFHILHVVEEDMFRGEFGPNSLETE